jgi:glyoxylase-like metal-dependent hydrolase (beta-lactamase superfamily II)
MHLGNIQIDRILEMALPFMDPLQMFPDATASDIDAHRHWLQPAGLCPHSGKIVIAIQTWLIRTRHHTILVDTCLGCDKTNAFFPEWHRRSDRSWLATLQAKGLQPGDIDYVFCTHLHSDHCGWNTQLVDGRFVPTFPNARYLISAVELQHAAQLNTAAYQESVLPVIESGQVRAVNGDFRLDDQVWLEPTPGHTPGHVAVHLQSGAQRAVLCGDLIHSPLQCHFPRWRYWVDSDPQQAIATRLRFLEQHSDARSLVSPPTFPAVPWAMWRAHQRRSRLISLTDRARLSNYRPSLKGLQALAPDSARFAHPTLYPNDVRCVYFALFLRRKMATAATTRTPATVAA